MPRANVHHPLFERQEDLSVTPSSPLVEHDLLGVLCLTARTSIYRLPTKTRGALLARPHASQSDARSGRPRGGLLRWTHFPRS